MATLKNNGKVPSSFRDPAGFLFYRTGDIYRQINIASKEAYDLFIESGLYQSLVDESLIIEHKEVDIIPEDLNKAYKIIKPDVIPFISYPYEWCFSQLKDAALITLKIQRKALDFGLSLKDCSAYNIQFFKGSPIFIDTLSFEKYQEGKPWVAYRQFCQHFLCPLALICYKDMRLSQLLKIFIDGIPIDLTSSLLSFRTKLIFGYLTHIHLHAKTQKHFADKTPNISHTNRNFSNLSFRGLIDNLESLIKRLKWKISGTEWGNYYEDTNYSTDAMVQKEKLIEKYVNMINPKCVWDIGANTGFFSRISATKGITTISWDIDPLAVEKNYLSCKGKNEKNILPLILDLTNPSSGIGWAHNERMSFVERAPAEMVFALALIHHLSISNNLPFAKISEFFSKICDWLVIEFVHKDDSQVQRLLSTREDIFTEYTQTMFEYEFNKYFVIQEKMDIEGAKRTMYLMKRGEIR